MQVGCSTRSKATNVQAPIVKNMRLQQDGVIHCNHREGRIQLCGIQTGEDGHINFARTSKNLFCA
eukprot:6478812-Amphidinium_carterae.1